MNTQSKILITGATGFLGSYLVKFLVKNGYQHLSAICRRPQLDYPVDGITWKVGDLLDMPFVESAVDGMDYVFHCGAIISYDAAERKNMYETNIVGTEYLVNACLSNDVKKLIYVSSIAAIGRPEDGLLIDESTTWSDTADHSHYGRSKHLGEREVWRGVAEGLRTTIVNPSVILGAGNWKKGSQKLFRTVAQGLKYYPSGTTGFVDVRDVVEFMVRCADPSFDDERYILNGANLSWRHFFERVAEGLGVAPPTKEAGPISTELARVVSWIRNKLLGEKSLITKDTIATSRKKNSYNANKSISQGFSYRPIDETIAETTAMYLRKTGQLLDF